MKPSVLTYHKIEPVKKTTTCTLIVDFDSRKLTLRAAENGSEVTLSLTELYWLRDCLNDAVSQEEERHSHNYLNR